MKAIETLFEREEENSYQYGLTKEQKPAGNSLFPFKFFSSSGPSVNMAPLLGPHCKIEESSDVSPVHFILTKT